ncbi:MAG TPA: type II CAAX endopeptidase family protein [Daejeonella sp.]|nr:type II CAAX endopeptidase family protein [Daejeonella sp.]
MKKLGLILIGFLILFALYHGAEFMIVSKNSPIGFLGFQFSFFIAAWIIAKWQTKQGMAAWGLDTRKFLMKHLALGMLMGLVLYELTFTISLLLGIEKVVSTPTLSVILSSFGLFVFGNFFASVSEDILTRGYVFKHLHGKVHNGLLVIISASIYVLNHIYRLGEGFETYLYLFLLGVIYVIPLLLTKRLWFTGGMHWAGNCFFYLTHEVFKTDTNDGYSLSPNYILVLSILLIIPLNYWLLGKLKMIDRATDIKSNEAGLVENWAS